MSPSLKAFLECAPMQLGSRSSRSWAPPTAMDEGWHRLPLVAFDADACQGWERAWHGCKVEAVYSILYHGQLVESRGLPGERLLEGAPGVYTHRDCLSHKAHNYIRFVSLCGDGTFWAAKWELRANLADKVKTPSKTDQLVVRAKGVQLVALWVCGRAAADMQSGDEVNIQWNPKMEANPASEEMSMRLATGAEMEPALHSTDTRGAAEHTAASEAPVSPHQRQVRRRTSGGPADEDTSVDYERPADEDTSVDYGGPEDAYEDTSSEHADETGAPEHSGAAAEHAAASEAPVSPHECQVPRRTQEPETGQGASDDSDESGASEDSNSTGSSDHDDEHGASEHSGAPGNGGDAKHFDELRTIGVAFAKSAARSLPEFSTRADSGDCLEALWMKPMTGACTEAEKDALMECMTKFFTRKPVLENTPPREDGDYARILKSDTEIQEAWQIIMEKRRLVEPDHRESIEDPEQLVWLWKKWRREWLNKNLTKKERNKAWSERKSIFNAWCFENVGEQHFVMGVWQTGMAWAPWPELLNTNFDGAVEHVVTHFPSWTRRLARSVARHKTRPLTDQARIRSRRGMTTQQVKDREEREKARHDYYITVRLANKWYASQDKACTDMSCHDLWWLEQYFNGSLLKTMRQAEAKCHKIQRPRFWWLCSRFVPEKTVP